MLLPTYFKQELGLATVADCLITENSFSYMLCADKATYKKENLACII